MLDRREEKSSRRLDWRAVEALGHAYFCQRGWRILMPLYEPTFYDFVAERDAQYVRVQVKRASPRPKNCGGYLISKPGRNRSAPDPDLYLIWLPREEAFIELPGDFLATASCRAIPVALIQEKLKP